MKLKLDSAAKRRNLMATSVLAGVAALGAPAMVMLATTLAPTAALAQDYTSGTFVGHVTDSSGAPVAGAAVTVRSQSTGVTQNTTTDSTGTFRAPLVPSGSYAVTIRKAGFTDIAQDGLAVRIGGESNYGFTLTNPNDVDAVVVVAKKPQPQLDFSQTTKGVAIDVEQLQKQVPIARNSTAIALLAPGVVTAVPGLTDTNGNVVPSIGGSTGAENAFYLNGLNITNFDTYVGGSTVPFDFYKTIEIKTGGYPAEFGRATGGVVNAVTKSGTNDLYFAVHGDYTPDALRSRSPNTYSVNYARDYQDSAQTTIEAGGPLWRDHLFLYGLYQFNNSVQTAAGNTGATVTGLTAAGAPLYNSTLTKRQNTSPFYGYKVDFYLTSRQHFEFTDFNTTTSYIVNSYQFHSPTTNYVSSLNNANYINGGDGAGSVGAFTGATKLQTGGNNFVAKYTGTFTDWFTISGAYGKTHDRNNTLPGGTNSSYVTDARANGTAVLFGPTPAANASLFLDTAEREFYRVDGDIYANFLGKHHFRAGYDHEDTSLSKQTVLTGGASYEYFKTQSASEATSYGFTNPNQEYLAVTLENLGGGGSPIRGTNEAFYIQDSWDVTRQLNLQIGIRDDIFQLYSLSNERVLNLDDNISPRLALSFDPFGHSTDKIFASYGRYFIPPASNLEYRSADFGGTAYFLPPGNGVSYNGDINPATGQPIALGNLITSTAFTNAFQSGAACPKGFPVISPTGCSISYGTGLQEPAATKAATNLKASYEDEFIVGYQKKFNNLWSGSATVTYRNLGKASEDIDNLDVAINNYCVRNPGHVGCNLGAATITQTFANQGDYKLINPGYGATITVRPDEPDPNTGAKSVLAGQTFDLTSADLGFPKAKREYYALELAFDRAFDGKWSLNGSYTLSKLVGNYEGTVKSNVGSSGTPQTDAGSTTDFDYPGLEDYAYGLLPNHAAHQIKLYGSYAILHDLLIGANLRVQSPRHYGCTGYYPYPTNAGGYGGIDTSAAGYGNASHYCYSPTLGYSVGVPQGSAFEGDWFYQMDVSLRYTVPKFIKYQPNLVLRADVFNIFDAEQVIRYDEVGNSSARAVRGTYQLPIQYQSPRSVRVGFDLVF